MDETVTITMTRDHAWVVQDACEMLMRMKLGQTIMPTELMLEWPNGDMTWYEYCLRRDVAKSALTTFLTAVGCPEGTPKDDTEHMAYEIYGTIRHALYLADGGDRNGWSVAAREPLSESGHDMPKCEVTNDG